MSFKAVLQFFTFVDKAVRLITGNRLEINYFRCNLLEERKWNTGKPGNNDL
jgi:hypothetical protein